MRRVLPVRVRSICERSELDELFKACFAEVSENAASASRSTGEMRDGSVCRRTPDVLRAKDHLAMDARTTRLLIDGLRLLAGNSCQVGRQSGPLIDQFDCISSSERCRVSGLFC